MGYNGHGVDDGVRSGLLTLEQVEEVPLFRRFLKEALDQHPQLKGRRLLFDSIRRMLSEQVYDVLRATGDAVRDAEPSSVDEVRRTRPLVSFSPAMAEESVELKRFLRVNLYPPPQAVDTTGRAKDVIRELFAAYRSAPPAGTD